MARIFPIISQVANVPKNDCGIATMLSFCLWLDKSTQGTVREWSAKIDAPDDGTTAANLADLARRVGLTPIIGIAAKYPYNELVNYKALPKRYSATLDAPHWIVRTSDTTYNDPNWPEIQGLNITTTKATLDAAEIYKDGSRRVGIVERPTEGTGLPRVQYARVVNVLPDNATIDDALALMRQVFINKQTISFSYDDAGVGALSDKTAVLYNIPELKKPDFTGFYSTYYPSTKVEFKTLAAPEPPPTQLAPYVLGANTLYTTSAAEDAIAAGAQAILTVDNAGDVAKLKLEHPDVYIVARRTWNGHYLMDPAQLVSELGVQMTSDQLKAAGKGDYQIIYVGCNENDHADWNEEWIPKRAAWDLEVAQRIKSINPSFDYAAYVQVPACNVEGELRFADLISKHYAPWYNNGAILVDHHSYTQDRRIYRKNADGEFEYWWYEVRPAFLFDCCGFDPNVRGIISTECGLLGPDRFNAGLWTQQQVTQWWLDFVAITRKHIPEQLFSCAWQWADSIRGIGRPSNDWAADELAGQWRGAMVNAFNVVNANADPPDIPPTTNLPPKPSITRPASDGPHKHVKLSTLDPLPMQWIRADFYNLVGMPTVVPRLHDLFGCIAGVPGEWVVEGVDEGTIKYCWILFKKSGGYAVKFQGQFADPEWSDDKPIKVGCQTQTQPPPIPTALSTKNLLGWHCMTNGSTPNEAITAGATALTLMNQPLLSQQLSQNTNLFIMHRFYFANSLPSTDVFLSAHGINLNVVNANDRRVILGANENDAIGASASEIRTRGAWDAANFNKLKQVCPNAKYAGGGWAHGNLDFGNADVVQALKDVYAPLYNAGMLVNLHNYTYKGIGVVDPIWFERRFQFFFALCNFNPAVRGIVSDETGLEGIVCHGGFIGCGYNGTQFTEWCNYYVGVMLQPLPSGHASPVLATTLFQAGGNGDPQWNDYEIRHYVNELKAQYAKPANTLVASARGSAGGMPPFDYVPVPKIMQLDATE